MKDKRKWLIASFICVGAGIIIITIGRMLGGTPGFYIDRTGLHTSGESLSTAPIRESKDLEEFTGIDLDVDYADVEIVVSNQFAIEYCVMGDYGDPVCEVENGRLIFREAEYRNIRIWNFTFFGGNPWIGGEESIPDYYVRIEVPEGQKFDQILAEVEDGDIELPAIQADELVVNNEYGNVSLKEYTGKTLKIDMESGALKIGINKASRTDISNEYGNVEIESLSGDTLQAKLEDGKCRVENLEVTDAEIKNVYGDVELWISGEAKEYGFDLFTEYGFIHMNDEKGEREYRSDEVRYKTEGSSKRRIKVSCEDGNITVSQNKS